MSCLREALGIIRRRFEKLIDRNDCKLVSNEPAIQFALTEDCRTQCRIAIETRTQRLSYSHGRISQRNRSVFI